MDAPIGRAPASDLDAEAGVLSACLLDQAAFDKVQALLQPRHFYADANRLVYQAMQELAQTGKPMDVVSVADVLRAHSKLPAIGGTMYLAQLSDATPAIANVLMHAQIIVDKWNVRTITQTCQSVAVEGYSPIGDVGQWKQSVDQRVYAVTRQHELDDQFAVIGAAAAAEVREIQERRKNKGLVISGITTGLPTLDARIGGLKRGNKYEIGARPGMGKAQPLWSKVHTPRGWTTMGALKVGDLVSGASGKPVRVKRIFEQGMLPVFMVTMEDGGWTLCCDEHLWFARHRRENQMKIRALSEIRTDLRTPNGGFNYTIPYAKFDPMAAGKTERAIKRVVYAGRATCRCIELDSEDHLYVTDDYIVTHNTGLLLNMMIAAARQGHGVVCLSLEMPRDQLALRALSQESNIDGHKLGMGRVTDSQWKDLVGACVELEKLPIIICDTGMQTISTLRSSVRDGKRRLKEKFGDHIELGVVGIDYMQLMRVAPDILINGDAELTAISQATTQLAKDEKCVVLECAQLNREIEKEKDKRPMGNHFRGSGSIEQDAFGIFMIYREDKYRKEGEERDNRAEILVRKIRNGGQEGVVHCKFKPQTVTFYEASSNPDYKQLGDMFDDFIPGQYDEAAGGSTLPEHHWQDQDD